MPLAEHQDTYPRTEPVVRWPRTTQARVPRTRPPRKLTLSGRTTCPRSTLIAGAAQVFGEPAGEKVGRVKGGADRVVAGQAVRQVLQGT